MTVAICTHRAGPDLVDATTTALAQLSPDDELVIVRSGGGRRLPEAAAFTDPRVRLVEEPRIGAALARAKALSCARTDVVLFLDDDCTPDPGWCRALRTAVTGQGVGAAGGAIRVGWPDGRAPSWLPPGPAVAYGERLADGEHLPFGASMAVRREAAAGIGFHHDLGHVATRPGLHEETELCHELLAAGWKVVDVPEAVVTHHVRRDQLSRRWFLRRSWHEGRSDARRDRRRSTSEPLVRTGKMVVLLAVLPLALLRPRRAAQVAGRLLVNAGYLYEHVSSRHRRQR